MKIALMQVGKTTEKYLDEGILIYRDRIRKYVPFDIVTVPDVRNTRNMPVNEQKNREGEGILKALQPDDYIVLLDERGKEMSTVDFSSWLERMLMIPKKRIAFIIGGPWGVSGEISGEADFTLCLSKMTFSHQITRLLFLEQLYRAFTIIRGEPYHHV